MDRFPGGSRSQTFNCLGVPDIEMVDINILSTSVSSMTYDDLHTLNRYEEKVGESISTRTHHNLSRVCYRHGKYMLSRIYCAKCILYVCPDGSGKDKSQMCFSDHKPIAFGKENQ